MQRQVGLEDMPSCDSMILLTPHAFGQFFDSFSIRTKYMYTHHTTIAVSACSMLEKDQERARNKAAHDACDVY